MVSIGQRCTLKVVRSSSPGIYLDGQELGEILLPNRYVPQRIAPGDWLNVFIYRDSQDRLVATTEMPKVAVGGIAKLKVVGIHQKAGAFLDWGLPKDLLLPFREQTGPVHEGQEVLVRVYLDEKTGRIAATMRLDDQAPVERPLYRRGQAVGFVVTEKTALGYKALVDGAHPGLLYHESVAVPVKIGQNLKGYIREIRPDGKIDLSLEEAGFRRVGPLATRIVKALEQNKGKLDFDDDSSSEAIRQKFGASKKAFKQALGTLYKARRIRFCRPGIELVDE